MDEVHVYVCLHTALMKFTAGDKTRLFLGPFLIFTSWSLILDEEFRNDYVAACSMLSAVLLRRMNWVAT